MVNLDLAVRDGNTVTVIWMVPEDDDGGPTIELYNHTTGERTATPPERLLPWFIKKKHILLSTGIGFVVGAFIFWMLAVAALLAPYIYFRRRALNAIKSMLSGSTLGQLEAKLAQVKPVPPAAAA